MADRINYRMDDYVSQETAVSGRKTEREDFGVFDNKGRAVGACVTLTTRTYEKDERPTVGRSYCTVKPGTYFAFTPHATRAEKPFGGSSPTRLFETEAERDAAKAKYFAQAKARAVKQFGG